MATQHKVIHGAHVREEFDILKCPGNPLFGNLVRFEIGDVISFEEDLSRIWLINSTDAIEDGGLSGSIGSNDGIDGPFLHLKAHITQSSDAAKRDRQVFCFEYAHFLPK
jgi:hypothetical protein